MSGALFAQRPFALPLAKRVKLLLDRVSYRHPETEEEKDAIFQLRYNAYLREGAIVADASARVRDRFDDMPNGKSIGVYVDGVLAAAIRIHLIDSGLSQSPALDAFADHLGPLVAAGTRIIDPNRFVADHAVSRLFPELPYVVLRLPFMAADHWEATFVTATVRRDHAAFYRRVLRCSKISDPRPYPTLLKPLGLMMVNYPQEAIHVLERYPFFAPQPREFHRIFGATKLLDVERSSMKALNASI